MEGLGAWPPPWWLAGRPQDTRGGDVVVGMMMKVEVRMTVEVLVLDDRDEKGEGDWRRGKR